MVLSPTGALQTPITPHATPPPVPAMILRTETQSLLAVPARERRGTLTHVRILQSVTLPSVPTG